MNFLYRVYDAELKIKYDHYMNSQKSNSKEEKKQTKNDVNPVLETLIKKQVY